MITVPNVTAFLAVLFIIATLWQGKRYLDAWYDQGISRTATESRAMVFILLFLATLLFCVVTIISGKPI